MRKDGIATLAYFSDFAYIQQSNNVLIYRGQRSRKHVVVVGIRCGSRYRLWWWVVGVIGKVCEDG